MAESFNTPPGIISWPHLFQPRPVVVGGEPRFSVTLILDKPAQAHEQWTKIRRQVAKVIDERWGNGKCKDQAFVRSLRMPWMDCANKSQYGGFAVPGGIYINPWSKQKPNVFDRRVSPILDPLDVWAGQMAILSINVWAYQQSANRGVSMSLNNVQIIRTDGPRLDGRSTTGSEFTPLDDEGLEDVGAGADADDPPF